MPDSKQPYILADHLTYHVTPITSLFQNISLSIEPGDRIALVGANGVGKSTLLKILANQIAPSAGSVHRNGSIYYLPQISTLKRQITAHTVLDFLNSVSDEWWMISNLLETTFNTSLDLALPMNQLSGGELTKLFLAIGLAQQPNVLLLDEPTNHMDHVALEELRQFLCQFEGAFVLVSHKPFFLDHVVHTTWELSAEGLAVYGGNFSLYREQKQIALDAQQRSHEVARKELKRAKAAAIQAQKRAAQSRKQGTLKRDSMPKILAGAMKRKAEVTAGKQKLIHDAAIADATQNVAATKVKTQKAAGIQLEERCHKHKNLIEVQGANLWVADRLLVQNIHLHIATGDRLVIAGANGSGKSSLAKALLTLESSHSGLDQARLEGGEQSLSPSMKAVYLDQTYCFVNRDQTILENMQTANPTLNYQLIRQQLGHFLFFNDDVHKSASLLSGGELARLAIAMITVSKIDLLILDEPTNNLDITTVDQLTDAINEYQGTLWIMSHDLDFLSRIQLTSALKISHQTLHPMAHLPSESNAYYQELLDRA